MLFEREGTHRHLPFFLEAKTAKGLHNKIKIMQREKKTEYRFISFYYDQSKKTHVAWYYNEVTIREEIQEYANELITK